MFKITQLLFVKLRCLNKIWILATFILLLGFQSHAQDYKIITGIVTESATGDPVLGANVILKGTEGIGTVTDFDGKFTLRVPSTNAVLVFSYIGYQTVEKEVGNSDTINIVLNDSQMALDEVVVVGYGKQKKESVVGAISQVKGETLQRAGGVTNLGAALTGNVPGLTVTSSTGMPGEENPNILIRAQTSWNNSSPLVLVDGVERPLSDVDINSVETLSILKDASATAIFGVRGANGVILITTKRGQLGKATISVNLNTTAKTISKLPNKYDVYDALMLKNRIVEYELGRFPEEGGAWAYINSQEFIENYRNQTTQEQRERYPNIDWTDYLFKDMAMSYGANINIRGGSKSVKYFSSVDYVSEGDLFKKFNDGQGYQPKFAYDRINTRTNLDFDLTKSTSFKVNLFGSYGVRTSPNGVNVDQVGDYVSGAYNMPGDVFYPHYADGAWGFYYPERSGVVTQNSARIFATAGVQQRIDTRFSTDFILHQDLDAILKGLNVEATMSWDNRFNENGRGITGGTSAKLKWIDPKTGIAYSDPDQSIDGTTQFDWVPVVNWGTSGGEINNNVTYRALNYNVQLNYDSTFYDKHNVTLMGRFMRRESSGGSSIPGYNEDWIFRATYNFDRRYFLEYNGAYNGSEKFGKKFRFGFFSSGAIGWTLTEEKFMQNVKFLDNLKIRASYGKIGDDNAGGVRFLYQDQWAYGGNSELGTVPGAGESSPYTWFKQTQLGNPDIHWETVTKKNLGIDFAILKNMVSGTVEVFHDFREDILIKGGDRAVPSYFGVTPTSANVGKVKGEGYEIELHFNKALSDNWRMWTDLTITKAKNVILDADDPLLLPDYMKRAGFANGQAKSYLSNGYYNTMDELYGSTPFITNDTKIPGSYNIIDYDGDGVIDNDQVPYGYSGTPQKTYNLTVGFEWKGFRVFAQFYGVNNVSRWVGLNNFNRPFLNTAYDAGSYWSSQNTNPDTPLPRLVSNINGNYLGDRYMYDGSYIRLKNAEIAYTFNAGFAKKLGFNSMRVYLNGNNLWSWTRMPDDRESSLAGGVYVGAAYPTVKRYNLGLNVNF
ncbi:SusC/RagA family TonB-linked outer membrane protein [Confluentibacter sediminis]|uniref:SusC/RagA family TonB-linked outer membrane protein n=1 Tax=Confluentibacter sediminis TaxID=2219045 RepID=UPI000DAEEE52|nr:SusC/RagA family TonB-linked outer membrane protein [Confluentibacter sediminis]